MSSEIMQETTTLVECSAFHRGMSVLEASLRNTEDLESVLDEKDNVWYNEDNDEISERTQYEEDPVYLSRQYLPQPDGRVCDEGLGEESWAVVTIPYRVGGY